MKNRDSNKARRAERQASAAARQAGYDALTLEQKVEALNLAGLKAGKQRAKLARAIFARDSAPKAKAKKKAEAAA